MKCPHCGYQFTHQLSRFCPECGTPLSDQKKQPAAEIHIQQDVGQGSATGLKIKKVHGDISVINGHVIKIENPTPELIEKLTSVKAISTELPVNTEHSTGQDNTRIVSLEESVNEILQHIRKAEQTGEQIDEISAGNLKLSRVELIMKQAVLKKTEADQLMLDTIRDKRGEINETKNESEGPDFQLDLNTLMQDFDEAAYTGKLMEAYQLLKEAHEMEPVNAEVLLLMAQVVDQLEHDPDETQRILYKVQNLLYSPKNDTEKFQLAQAKFLSAVTAENLHVEELRSARDMFKQLGRTDWEDHCNSLLDGISSQGSDSFSGYQTRQSADVTIFQPHGDWNIALPNGGILHTTFRPDGQMQGVQNLGYFGMQTPFSGQWFYDSNYQYLQLNGIIAGSSWFLLQINIHRNQGNSFIGTGSDGLMYQLTPAVRT